MGYFFTLFNTDNSLKRISVLLIHLLVFVSSLAAQSNTFTISGTVKLHSGEPAAYANVYLDELKKGTTTDMNGHFKIDNLPKGTYTLKVSTIEAEPYSEKIVVGEVAVRLKIVLKEATGTELETVTVEGKTALKEVQESAYNVVALDAKLLHNSTLDLAHLLDKASGVKIRETGGVGSNTSITLNGFTGRHIKVFMDGVPMDGFGSAFQLNNIPVNIADRIEIYKGVVPIELGGDALGGAINIVTDKKKRTFLDVSYSFGSFNTHKSNVNFRYTAKKGFTVRLNAFQNFSDNSYKVKTQVLNLEARNYSEDSIWVKRFHDNYHNETMIANIGVVDKKWADELLFGVTLGKEKADIQNSNLMKIVFGERERKGTTLMPSFSYSKRDLFTKGLYVRLTANYNRNFNQNIDTAAVLYNWLGEHTSTRSAGEALSTMGKFYNNNSSVTFNTGYQLKEKHQFSFNNVWTTYKRKNADDRAIVTDLSALDTIPRSNFKNISGLSYRYVHNKSWNTSVFGKYYIQSVTGPVDTSKVSGSAKYAEMTRKASTYGYGMATTYIWRAQLQFKASVEKSFRLPNERELFGDEVLEVGNSNLKPENSMNYNFGVTYEKNLGKNHAVFADASFMYRDTRDYIIRTIEARYGSAVNSNHGRVTNMGVNAEFRYYFKRLITAGGNITYQNLRNKEKYVSPTSSQLSTYYGDRVPNMPYLFGNGEISFNFENLLGKETVLNFTYYLNYVHEFYLRWPSLGNASNKAVIPTQISHDASLTYTIKNGRYNIALEARNFTNTLMYDNFSLQKPGRSFSVKIRYFLMKNK